MKRISILTFLLFVNITIAQRGVKIGYIDTEYILENLTEYSEVSDRLEEKAQGWKDEISKRSREIEQKKESLNSERINQITPGAGITSSTSLLNERRDAETS